MIPTEWLDQARLRIEAHVVRTPLTFDATRQLYLKWENRQVTGSFKARGAFNKILALESWELQRGLVCASAGNHGQAVALAAKHSGARTEVFVAANAATVKVDKMCALGAHIHTVPGGYEQAETVGLAYAKNEQKTWISPYNDGMVIAGQGTIAPEVLDQLEGGAVCRVGRAGGRRRANCGHQCRAAAPHASSAACWRPTGG